MIIYTSEKQANSKGRTAFRRHRPVGRSKTLLIQNLFI